MKKRIISIDIKISTYKEAIELISKMALANEHGYFCFTNAHMTIEAHESKEFQAKVNGSTASFADGVPVAKACKLLHGIGQERIAGMDVFPDMLQKAEEIGVSVFMIGSTDETLAAIEHRIQKEHPNLKIAGMISPPFGKPWDNEGYIKQINDSGAQICFVALGCPKQENWMADHTDQIHMPLLGVGGAFPVYSGIQKRCPEWMANNGLEWVYRLYQEPKRLFKRYLVTNTKFVLQLLKQWMLG